MSVRKPLPPPIRGPCRGESAEDRLPEPALFVAVTIRGPGDPCFKRNGQLIGFPVNRSRPLPPVSDPPPEPLPTESETKPTAESSDSLVDQPDRNGQARTPS